MDDLPTPPSPQLCGERLFSLGLFAFLPSPQTFCPRPCQVCDHTLLSWAHAAWADTPGPRGPGERKKGFSVNVRGNFMSSEILMSRKMFLSREVLRGATMEPYFPRKENITVIWVGKRP